LEFTLGALVVLIVAGGSAAAFRWVDARQRIQSDNAALNEHMLGIETHWSLRPIYSREDGKLYYIEIMDPAMPEGIGSFAAGRREIQWPAPRPLDVHKFNFISFASTPIINMRAVLKLVFFNDGPEGRTEIAHKKVQLPILNIGVPGQTEADFYVWNDTPYYIEVRFPDTVHLLSSAGEVVKDIALNQMPSPMYAISLPPHREDPTNPSVATPPLPGPPSTSTEK
jgi:hypothetical protein